MAEAVVSELAKTAIGLYCGRTDFFTALCPFPYNAFTAFG